MHHHLYDSPKSQRLPSSQQQWHHTNLTYRPGGGYKYKNSNVSWGDKDDRFR